MIEKMQIILPGVKMLAGAFLHSRQLAYAGRKTAESRQAFKNFIK